MKAYADTSFLVSLYTPDAHSTTAAAQMKHLSAPLFLTPFIELELLNAFQLRIYRGELSHSEIDAASAALREDVEKGIYIRRSFPAGAFERARELSLKRTSHLGTRTLDILHIASALILQADVFYSFDKYQVRLARAEGMRSALR